MTITPISPTPNVFDDDDDEGWQDMPVVREDEFAGGLDEEDQKKYHYVRSAKGPSAENATGNLIDIDDYGNEWRSKLDQNESEYTRLRVNDDDDVDEVHLRTKYLFDEDKAMTPLSQMQATKDMLTEAQRIAYVGICALTSREMSQALKITKRRELKAAVGDMELWVMKIMGRLYYHMELETQEQKMIESLGEHGVVASDLVPALMTTRTVANPEYDPVEALKQTEERQNIAQCHEDNESVSNETLVDQPSPTIPDDRLGDTEHDLKPSVSTITNATLPSHNTKPTTYQTTARVLEDTSTTSIPGVTLSLSSTDENVTLDIRWTVLCDLFLVLVADSVYDARSRVLLENVALKLGLGWLDLVKFESRVTEALEIQEDVDSLEQKGVIEGQQKAMKKRRYMMLGLATLGGGLVIGLSAGLLAPVIGAGIGAALTTIGIGGTTGFLAGVGGTAVITTGGVLTGSGIAVRGMAKRTQLVRTFDILPLHNNKRVSCILTVPGFMNGPQDDVRLPFSVLDPVVGDVYSVLWEPEMIQETGSALKILTGEILSQIGITVLQATVMSALMTALQWPIILTKLGYLIDNPWSNALDRARAAGRVLADVLINRHLGVRPITLIGFSLGARVIFYALLELAKNKTFGIVQDVFLLGATLTASTKVWCEARSAVSGRFVNVYARNDWVLNYLFRATSGGVGTVAGLRPVNGVPGLENVEVTDKIAGHMSYRAFMPLILDQLGFPVSADYFDEPEEPDFTEDRIVVTEGKGEQKKGWFSRKKKSTLPGTITLPLEKTIQQKKSESADDLPPRIESNDHLPQPLEITNPTVAGSSRPSTEEVGSTSRLPARAGFDFEAIRRTLHTDSDAEGDKFQIKPVDIQATLPKQAESASPQYITSDMTPTTVPHSADKVPSPSSIPQDDISPPMFSQKISLSNGVDGHSDREGRTSSLTFADAHGGTTSPTSEDTVYTPRPRAQFPSSPYLPDVPAWSSPTDAAGSPYTAFPASGPSRLDFSPTSPPMSAPSSAGVHGSVTSPGPDPWKIPGDLGAGKNSDRSTIDGLNRNPWS